MNSIPPFANLVAPLIKSASFNCNLVSIDQFPRSQSLCGFDRQTKARPTITAVRGATGTSNGVQLEPSTAHCGIQGNSKA